MPYAVKLGQQDIATLWSDLGQDGKVRNGRNSRIVMLPLPSMPLNVHRYIQVRQHM